ncbi:MAG: hypothetical protein PUJ05_12650 [Clostridium sp.]|uniref:hypothetical protein n=1 Tax=Clostridium sp. TaxID=1506 RepID=UPI002671FE21|nr:hypothetical protein [Clostridium sp.]MCI7029420.1 hypothetical protein [Clostridium sp.]MDD7683764.1 hypothetical protein [Clostridium sp.]MDY2581206.1 hypothetical protein [Clostridium sp.]
MTIKENKPLLVNLIYMAVLIITFIYKYAIKDYDELFRIGLAAVTAWIVYFVCKITFLKKSEICFYVILAFTFSAIYLGNVWDLYRIIPIYDKLLHLLSGVIIAIIGFVLFLYLNNGNIKGDFNTYFAVIFSIIFSIAAAGLWEIWEFSTDMLFGFHSQNNSLIDTMMDIICGSIMGIIANIPIYLYIKGKNISFIEKIIDEINR